MSFEMATAWTGLNWIIFIGGIIVLGLLLGGINHLLDRRFTGKPRAAVQIVFTLIAEMGILFFLYWRLPMNFIDSYFLLSVLIPSAMWMGQVRGAQSHNTAVAQSRFTGGKGEADIKISSLSISPVGFATAIFSIGGLITAFVDYYSYFLDI